MAIIQLYLCVLPLRWIDTKFSSDLFLNSNFSSSFSPAPASDPCPAPPEAPEASCWLCWSRTLSRRWTRSVPSPGWELVDGGLSSLQGSDSKHSLGEEEHIRFSLSPGSENDVGFSEQVPALSAEQVPELEGSGSSSEVSVIQHRDPPELWPLDPETKLNINSKYKLNKKVRSCLWNGF